MSKKYTYFLIAIIIALLSVLFFIGGYVLGLKKQEQKIQFLQNEKAVSENRYSESMATLRKETGLGFADYQSSCYEYKKLRQAYEALYARTGENSGLPIYTFPDSARGNEDSCYR